jgi:hypothetical protein
MQLFSLFLLTILGTTALFNAVKAAADADIQRNLRLHYRNTNNNNNDRRIQDESSNFHRRTQEGKEGTVDENNDERNDDGEDTSELDSNTSVEEEDESESESESESKNQGNYDGDDTSALDSNSSVEKGEDEQESEGDSPVETPVSSPVESESFDSPDDAPNSSPVESESFDSPDDAPNSSPSSPVESESFDSPDDAPNSSPSSPVESKSFDSPDDAPVPIDSPVVAKEENEDQESPSSSTKNDENDNPVSTSTEAPTYYPTKYKEPSIPTAEYRSPTQRPTLPYFSSDDDPLKNDELDEADNMDSSFSEEWGWNDSTIEEIEHDKTVLIALSVVFGVMFFFSIFVAYQMLENPEGCCARLVIMCDFVFVKSSQPSITIHLGHLESV